MRISDYLLQEILAKIGTETRKIGKTIVCRCPICKGDNDFRAGHNAIVNINADPEKSNVFCQSGCFGNKGYTRTELVKKLNLYSLLDIQPFDENRKRTKPAPESQAKPEPETDTDIKEIERLLSAEIPPILWDRTAESYKNIGLTEWNHENRLLFSLSGGTTITRNAGNIKWKWFGRQPIFNHLTDKKLVFIASGVAEWLIVDWLGVDYIVLPSDSQKARIADFKAELQGKAVIILPDADKPGVDSFQKVINTVKENAPRVHVAGFYPDHDFRDYCRRVAPEFKNKQDFIDALKLNIFTELGGSESADTVNDDEIFNLIPVGEIKPEQDDVKPEPAKAEPDDYDKTIADLWNEVRPELILNKFYKKTLSIIAGNSGAGKTYISIQQSITAALAGKKVCLWPSEDIGFMGQRIRETIEFLELSSEQINKIKENLIIRYEVAKPIFSKKYGYERDEKAVEWFINYILLRKLDLLILDSFNRFSSGLQENMPSEIGQFMNVWHEISLKTNCAVVFLHHLSQAGLSLTMESSMADKQGAVRGAGAILATARANFIFLSDKDIKNKKYLQALDSSNYLESGKTEEYYMPFKMPDDANSNYEYQEKSEPVKEKSAGRPRGGRLFANKNNDNECDEVFL
jgi:hypothetical protein